MRITNVAARSLSGLIIGKDGQRIRVLEYDPYHGWYRCMITDWDEDDNEIQYEGVCTPSDLIGGEIL